MKNKKDKLKEKMEELEKKINELDTFLENWKKVIKENEENEKKEK